MSHENDKNSIQEPSGPTMPDRPLPAGLTRRVKPPIHFQTVPKSFEPGDYNGTNTQDFIDRLTSFMSAAKAVARKSLLYREYKLTGLDEIERLAIRFLETKIKLPKSNPYSLKKAERKELLKNYKKNFNLYKKQMEKWLRQVLILLTDSGDETTAKLAMLEIQEEEKQQTAKNGRPSIRHRFKLTYTAPKRRAIPYSGEYTSNHQVLGQMTEEQLNKKFEWDARTGQPSGQAVSEANPYYTNPSTIRNTEGLSNFLRTRFAHQNDEETETLFEGYRHSSPTPLAIDNRIRRHAMTFRQLKQLVIQIARDSLTTLPKDTTTVPVNISSFSLLSNNMFESQRGNSNETRQILEVTMAIRYLHGREIETEIDGKPITIHVNSNNMTLGCNFLRNLPASFGKTIQDKINYRGFVRHNKHMLDFFLKNKPHDLSQSIIDLLNTLNFNGGYLNEGQIRNNERILINEYTLLEAAANEYEDAIILRKSVDEINEARKAYNAQEKKVNGFEHSLDYYYITIRDQRKTLWYNYKRNLKEKINELFRSTDPVKKNYANILQLYYDLNALYFEKNNLIHKKYVSSDYYFQFQARFLISAYLIGRTPDFFCKSGEDRAGRTNNIIEELLSHRHLTGRFAAFDDLKTRKSIEEQLSPDIHLYSASRETTGLNAKGSRGLQIAPSWDPQGSEHLYAGILDRKNAQSAKKIYNFDAVLNPALFSARSTIFKKDVQNTIRKKQNNSPKENIFHLLEEPRESDQEIQLSTLNLVNQSGALLSKINLAMTDKQLSDYLLLINQHLDSDDEASSTALLNAIKSEISPEKYQNPWMREIKDLKAYQTKLSVVRERLTDLIDIKVNLSLNKKRLKAIDKVLKKLNTSRVKKLFENHETIQRWLSADAALQARFLNLNLFLRQRPADSRKILEEVKTRTSKYLQKDLIPFVKKVLGKQVNTCISTFSLLETDLQRPKTFLSEYRFDIRIQYATSVDELNCWDKLLEDHAGQYINYQESLTENANSLKLLKDRYDTLLKLHSNTSDHSDFTLTNCNELIKEFDEGIKKIEEFRKRIASKISTIKEGKAQRKEIPVPTYVKTITAGADFLEHNAAALFLLCTLTAALLGANCYVTTAYLLGGFGLLAKGAERLKENPNLYTFFSSSEQCRNEMTNPTDQPPILEAPS